MNGNELDEISWPELVIPFPSQVNPCVEDAVAGGIAWARSMGLVTSEPAVARFVKLQAAWLAARAYPTAGRGELQLVADWCAWVFLFDDQNDEGRWGRHPEEWEALTAPLEAVLTGSFDEAVLPPLARALADLLWRSTVGMSAAWYTRLRTHVSTYIRSYRDETANRARTETPSLVDYIAHRRKSGAMGIFFDMAEFVEHTEVPAGWYASREYQDILLAASDVVSWDNDIFSLPKEFARGDVHNLPLIMWSTNGRHLQEALDRAAEMIHARIATYLGAERLMQQLLDSCDLVPETRDGIRRCMAVYRACMRAYRDWSDQTGRYRDVVPSADGTEPDYIEALLVPRRPDGESPAPAYVNRCPRVPWVPSMRIGGVM
jgi:hypothetical protein